MKSIWREYLEKKAAAYVAEMWEIIQAMTVTPKESMAYALYDLHYHFTAVKVQIVMALLGAKADER